MDSERGNTAVSTSDPATWALPATEGPSIDGEPPAPAQSGGDTPGHLIRGENDNAAPNMTEALLQLADVVAALRDDVHRGTQVYDNQRMLVDKLHSENEQLRRAELERARDPLVRDLISLADTCLRNGRAWRQRATVTPHDIDCVLQQVADDVTLILERQGVETFKPEEGTKFDRRETRSVRSVNTSNASLDGTIAEVLKPGYRIGDRVLRYCEAVVWAFTADPTAGTDNTSPADIKPNA